MCFFVISAQTGIQTKIIIKKSYLLTKQEIYPLEIVTLKRNYRFLPLQE